MVLPAMGVISELVAAFCRKPVFGYTLRGVFEPRHRGARVSRVGPPHVRGRPVDLRVAGVLAAELPCGDSVGHEGLQLDGHDVQGIGVVADADALRHRLHRAVHDRRADGTVPGSNRVRTCTSPTRTSSSRTSTTSWSAARSWAISAACTTGGRRSAAACIPRGCRSSSAGIIFIGFNLTFFPQFLLGYLGMPRRYHAYPPEFQVLNVLSSAGASILGVGYLLPMFYLAWSLRYGKPAGAESVGRLRPRMGNHVAAADGEFRGDADRHREPVQLPVTRGEARCLTTRRHRRRTRTTRRSRTISTTSTSSRKRRRSGCGCSC